MRSFPSIQICTAQYSVFVQLVLQLSLVFDVMASSSSTSPSLLQRGRLFRKEVFLDPEQQIAPAEGGSAVYFVEPLHENMGLEIERLACLVNEAYEYGERGMWKSGWSGRTSARDLREKLQRGQLLGLFVSGRAPGSRRRKSRLQTAEHQGVSAEEQVTRRTEDESSCTARDDDLAEGHKTTTIRPELIGQVFVDVDFAPDTAEFGMLALRSDYRQQGRGMEFQSDPVPARPKGLARALVSAAEEYAKERRPGLQLMRCELLEPADYEHPVKRRLHSWYTSMGYLPQPGDCFESFFVPTFPHIAGQLAGICKITVYLKSLLDE
ncbi:unnamed protein product [Amoebophrya sp. A120]|nr:unnamed protein product [Amoebophrya sp. A120]|eukprot:GSA120T00016782001.1